MYVDCKIRFRHRLNRYPVMHKVCNMKVCAIKSSLNIELPQLVGQVLHTVDMASNIANAVAVGYYGPTNTKNLKMLQQRRRHTFCG